MLIIERENVSIEEIIASAQVSINNFPFNGRFLIISTVEKITKYNNPYFSLKLKDKTGVISAKRFTRDKIEFDSLKSIYLDGNIVEIEGFYQHKWDSVKINSESLLDSYEYKSCDFENPSDIDVEKLTSTLMNTIDSIQNSYLNKLLNLIFRDNEIRQAYLECPASIGLHHSYMHGNLEHILSMIKIFQKMENNYKNSCCLNSDLIYTGIILHDIGKIKVYSIRNGIPVRNHGYGLIGHFTLGEEIVIKFIRKIEGFPRDIEWNLRHLILSHHGTKEYGAPVEPQTPEAIILHLLDLIDTRYNDQIKRL